MEGTVERFWTKNYEKGVPADITLEDKTVVDFFESTVTQFPNRPALAFMGRRLCYRELKEQVDRMATALAGLGVKKDSKVALWMPNLPQMVISFFATLKLGAQAVNTNPLYVEREIEHQFNDAGVTHVVTLDFLWWNKLRGILKKTKVQEVIVTSIPDYLPFPISLLAPLKLKKTGQYVKVPREAHVHFFKELIAKYPPTPPKVELNLKDVAVLQYTGGTTGVSKGAMLTHRNLSANVQQCAAWFPIVKRGEETLLACLPYFHVFGMTVSMLWPVHAGAQIVLAPNPRDIPLLVKSIVKYRVSLFPALPALFVAINNTPGIDKMDLSSVRGCFSGSAPLPIEVLERFEKLTGGKITEGFGLTETSPVTHVNPLMGKRKTGSVGVPICGTDMKIVDVETGLKELGVNQEGELCIKGPQIMAGYWNRPDETAKMLKDGWVYTGDLARVDDEGYTFIVGRKKDMIIAGGYNIYPDEIDGVLFSHPAVLEAATIGIPDAKRGETVKSFVVLKPGVAATADDIVAHCKKELAAYKVPKQVEIIKELPKSSMMKILRRELRDRELKKNGASPTA
ncbi:MAG: long-chain fatty acid--CoA ligase [Deltaproteobacteria bacterium]|nr:long-chain fatty acid--CoA ligase [Deltaproteobacteria bacterium]